MAEPAVRRIAHLPFEARDGTVLSAAVFLPEGGGRHPAILDAVPYRKDDDFLSMDWSTYGHMAQRGIACVRLDLRGTGSSEGILEDEYTEQELCDCEDTIAAIAALDWCNGRVGMTGVSWGGFNAVQVAMRRPPALGAIAPIHWSADRYGCDVHYAGGTFQLAEAVAWPGSMVVENALPPHRALVGAEAFERMWKQRLEQTPQWPLNWPRRQNRDAYWKHGSLCEDWGSLACPVLAIGGWHDGYRDATLALLANATVPRRAVIGPWGHTRPHVGWPAPRLDHRELMARWFLHWLADEDNGVEEEPMLLAFMLDGMPGEPFPDQVAGRWRAWRTWPAGKEAEAAFQLGEDGLGADPLRQPRTWSGPQGVGASMPSWYGGAPPPGYSDDMSPDDELSLTWDTPPLAGELTVLGRPRLELRVSADRPVALAAARLEHLRPDGRSVLIARGLLNLSRRDSFEHPEPLEPSRTYDVAIELMGAGITIPAGARLRLAVAGADFPIAFPPPEPVRLTVHAGRLTLPLPDDGAETEPPPIPQPAAGPPNPVVYETVPWARSIERGDGMTRTRLTDDWSARLPDGGRSAGTAEVTAEVADDPPPPARAASLNTATVEHDGVTAHARSRLEVSCTATHLVTCIDLEVERDGVLIFQRSWRDEAPRDFM